MKGGQLCAEDEHRVLHKRAVESNARQTLSALEQVVASVFDLHLVDEQPVESLWVCDEAVCVVVSHKLNEVKSSAHSLS